MTLHILIASLMVLSLLVSCVSTVTDKEAPPEELVAEKKQVPLEEEEKAPETEKKTIHYEGDLVIEGDETRVIEDVRFFIEGNIIVTDSATLVLRNANIIIGNNYPWQYWIKVYDEGHFTAENTILESPAQMNITAEGGTLLFKNFTAVGDIGITVGGVTISVVDSKRPFAQVFWKLGGMEKPSEFYAVNSSLERVDLTLGEFGKGEIEELEDIEIRGLKSGEATNVQFKTIEGANFELNNSSVEAWVIEYSSYSWKRVVIEDSHLDSVWLCFLSNDPDVTVKELKPSLYSDKVIQESTQGGYLRLKNTSVDWYKLLLYGVNAVVEDCESVQVAPWGDAQVEVKGSVIDWGVRLRGNDTIRFTDTLIKECGIWFLDGLVHDRENGGDTHVIEFSNSTIDTEITIACRYGEIKGDVSILIPINEVNFQTGEIIREYPLVVEDANQNRLANAYLSLTDTEGNVIWSGSTDQEGEALSSIAFTQENYKEEYILRVQVNDADVTKEIGFLTSTPVTIVVSPVPH